MSKVMSRLAIGLYDFIFKLIITKTLDHMIPMYYIQ